MLNPITTPLKLINDPKSIIQVLNHPTRHALSVFAMWYLGFSAVAAFLIGTYIAPNTLEFAQVIANDIATNFPQDAKINIIDNTLTTENLTTPFIIPLSRKPDAIKPNNIAIIDPDSPAESINQKDTILLFSSKALSTLTTHTKSPQVIPYNQITTDISIDSQTILNRVNQFKEFLQSIKPWLIPISFVIVFVSVFTARLFFILIYALLVQSIAILAKRDLNYSDAFKLSCLTILFSELINIIQIMFYQTSFPYVFTASFIGISTGLVVVLPKKLEPTS